MFPPLVLIEMTQRGNRSEGRDGGQQRKEQNGEGRGGKKEGCKTKIINKRKDKRK